MDAVQFIKERNRMCDKLLQIECRGCPFRDMTYCNHLNFMKGKQNGKRDCFK